MNKAELVSRMAEKSELTKKEAEMALNALMESIQEALVSGDKVQLVGFGTFEVSEGAKDWVFTDIGSVFDKIPMP